MIRVDGSYAQWSWIACAVIMVIVCAVHLTWTWRHRAAVRDD